MGAGLVMAEEPSLVERLDNGGYTVRSYGREVWLPAGSVPIWPFGFRSCVGYIQPKNGDIPETVVICYDGLRRGEDVHQENLETALEFRDFLEVAGIPYQERIARAAVAKDLRKQAKKMLKLADKTKGIKQKK